MPVAPAANTAGGFSMARQLGLSVSRIVIDPGHGGHDPGVLGKGLNEATLVLDVALRLEKLLLKEAGVDVVLTRRTDVYVPLEERTEIANRQNADMFLSIHANASRNPDARGIETFFLSFASSPEAEAVAARENSASAREMHQLPDLIKAITLNNKLDESRDLATMVQDSLVTNLRKTNKEVRSRGVKKAPFVVLIGAAMPSVLAEISFVSNRQELSLLKTPAYRQQDRGIALPGGYEIPPVVEEPGDDGVAGSLALNRVVLVALRLDPRDGAARTVPDKQPARGNARDNRRHHDRARQPEGRHGDVDHAQLDGRFLRGDLNDRDGL